MAICETTLMFRATPSHVNVTESKNKVLQCGSIFVANEGFRLTINT